MASTTNLVRSIHRSSTSVPTAVHVQKSPSKSAALPSASGSSTSGLPSTLHSRRPRSVGNPCCALDSVPTALWDRTTTFIAEDLEPVTDNAANRSVKRARTAGGVRTITREALLSRSSAAGQGKRPTTKKKNSCQGLGYTKKQMPYFEVAVDLMSRLPELATKQLFRNLKFFVVTQEASTVAATDSTTCKLEIVRIIFSIFAMNH